MSDKVYLKCSAKARDTRYGQIVNIGVKADDLIAFATQHKNARGYVNLTLSQRREPGQYGDTHSVTLDTYEPKAKSDATGFADDMEAAAQAITADDIPF